MLSAMCSRRSVLAILFAVGQGLPAVVAQKSDYMDMVCAFVAHIRCANELKFSIVVLLRLESPRVYVSSASDQCVRPCSAVDLNIVLIFLKPSVKPSISYGQEGRRQGACHASLPIESCANAVPYHRPNPVPPYYLQVYTS
jgi:hypothetical protein